jgi:hypothetical protein
MYLWQAASTCHVRADDADKLSAVPGMPPAQQRSLELLANTNRHLAACLSMLAHTRWDQRRVFKSRRVRKKRRSSLFARLLAVVLAWLTGA